MKIIRKNKYSLVIILSVLLIYNRNFLYSSSCLYRFESPSLKIWEESYSYFNITEIKNNMSRQLFLKNKTEYYRRIRTKYLLLKHNVIYNESKLVTFKDKLNWLIIHESPQYKSFLADKIRLREYSKKVLGKDICVPILKIYENAYDINFNELPNKFILKYNHGSGFNIICDDKKKLNFENVIKKLNNWKNLNYGLINKEFQYLYIKRRILVEKYLTNNIIDYKVYCFNGSPKFILVKLFLKDRNNTILNNYYNIDWKLNNLETDKKGYIRDPNYKIDKPNNLKLMLKYAKLLSQEFVFVRVDFFEVKNKVYLGELTFSPANALKKWKNKTDDLTLGNLLNLNKIKIYLYNK